MNTFFSSSVSGRYGGLVAMLAALLSLAACGGGGGGVQSPPAPPPPTNNAPSRIAISDVSLNNGGDPTLAHVFAGTNGTVQPASVSSPIGRIRFSFDVEVPAQSRAILMHFASQNANRTVAQTSADDLFNLRGEALRGMTVEEFQDVVNFDLTAATPLAVQKTRYVDCMAAPSGGDGC